MSTDEIHTMRNLNRSCYPYIMEITASLQLQKK